VRIPTSGEVKGSPAPFLAQPRLTAAQ